jgi:hypothetical protein
MKKIYTSIFLIFTLAFSFAQFCDQAQSSAGFPSNAACEASICASDPYCCSTQWDAYCASSALVNSNCASCLAPAAPINDVCTNAIPIACGSIVSGTTISASYELNLPLPCSMNVNAQGVWYSIVGNGNLLEVSTCNFYDFDTRISVFSGNCAALVCNGENDNACGLGSEVSWLANNGTTYYILVHGNGATGNFELEVSNSNQICEKAIPIYAGVSIGNSECSMNNPLSSCFSYNDTLGGVWYTYQSSICLNVELTTCSSLTNFDTQLFIYDGSCSSLNCIALNDDVPFGTCGLGIGSVSSRVSWEASANKTYYIYVTGYDGLDKGPFALTLTESFPVDTLAPVPYYSSIPDVYYDCNVYGLTSSFAIDNCAGLVFGTTNTILPITSSGTYVITWNYDDGNGNVSSQTQNVIVLDTLPPLPNIANLPDLFSECSLTFLSAPPAYDNCSNLIWGTTNTVLPITSLGTHIITWNYDDGNGNVSSQTQNVIVLDTLPPIPDSINLPNIFIECQLNSLQKPTATDACAGVIEAYTNTIFPINSPGIHTINWIFHDGNGNTAFQTQVVEIGDITPPEFSLKGLPDFIADCEVTSLPIPSVFDNCGGEVIVSNNGNFPITSDTLVTWFLEDESGNINSANQNVLITAIELDTSIFVNGASLTSNNNNENVTYQWVDCNNNFLPILGETNATFTATSNGMYALELSLGTCTKLSACVSVNSLSIQTISEIPLNFYPNPTSSSFFVNNSIKGVLEMYNLSGQLIFSRGLDSGIHEIPLEEISTGVYILQFINDTDIQVGRLVVSK